MLQNYLGQSSPASTTGTTPACLRQIPRPKPPTTPPEQQEAEAATPMSEAATVPGTLPSPKRDQNDSDAEVDGVDIPMKSNGDSKGGREVPEKANVPEVPKSLALLDGASPGYSPGSVVNSDGTMSYHPAEPFEDLWDEIPDVSDALAPRPVLGQAHISPEAVRSRSRRIFTKRGDGSKKVSDEIWDEWHSKGPKKRMLEQIFKQCEYDPDPWFSTHSRCKSFSISLIDNSGVGMTE